MFELNDKEFEDIMNAMYKYFGTVQFALKLEQVQDAKKILKKDLEVLLDKKQ